MITDEVHEESQRYLARVGTALSDVPDDERDEMLADLAGHLEELRAEGASITDRLGPPERYAAELRASAGFSPPSRFVVGSTRLADSRDRWRDRWQAFPLRRWFGPHRDALRQAWVVGRAWILVAAFGEATSNSSRLLPPEVNNSTLLGLAALVGATLASLRLATRRREGSSVALDRVVSGAAVIAVLALISVDGDRDVVYYDSLSSGDAYVQGPTTADGRQLLNVFAFDEDGNLLDGVYLYDQDGQPLQSVDVSAALPLDRDGNPVTNLYPQRSVTQDPNSGQFTVDDLRPPTVFLPPRGPEGTYIASPAYDPGYYYDEHYRDGYHGPPTTALGFAGGRPTIITPPVTSPVTPAEPSTTFPTVPTTRPPTTRPPTTVAPSTSLTPPTTTPNTTPPATSLVPALDPNLPPVGVPVG